MNLGRAGRRAILVAAGLGAFFLAAMAATSVGAAGEKYAVYGADTTPSERAQLAQLFGVASTSDGATVSTPEMMSALANSGLPVAASDKSISSAGLTCLNKGDGLSVQTHNITRITAPIYANALVTAGVGDAGVLIAAPQNNPVTGETALVGVLKAFPQCQAGKAPDASRVALAYQQIGWTLNLAGPNGDLAHAASTMLRAEQAVVSGQAKDAASVGQSLDQAAATEGLSLATVDHTALVQFLQRLSGLDYGAYAKGYQIQQIDDTQVKVVPAGPVASTLAPAAGAQYTGTVVKAGQPVTVRINNQDRQFGAATGAVVTRDGKNAGLSDLHKGDKVTIFTNPDGSAQRVDATSVHSGTNAWRWLLPLLLALLVIALLLLLWKRQRDSFVLEPNAGGRSRRRGQHA